MNNRQNIPTDKLLKALNKHNCNYRKVGIDLGVTRQRVLQLRLSRKIGINKTAYLKDNSY